MTDTESPGEPLPEIDFGTFVMSLAANALLHLGEAHEDGPAAKVDLPLAKQSIEIIGMLRDKTRGNLSPDEMQLLDGVLYDLRLRFLEASKKGTP